MIEAITRTEQTECSTDVTHLNAGTLVRARGGHEVGIVIIPARIAGVADSHLCYAQTPNLHPAAAQP